jgi:glycosyltransferase involved in cell wall biosynthesis
VYLLASGLAERGHKVTLFSSKESSVPGVKIIHFDINSKEIRYNLPIDKIPSDRLLEIQNRETFVHQNILSHIASEPFDIVHSNSWFWIYFLITPFIAKPPIVHTLYQIANYPTLVNAVRLLPKHMGEQLVAISNIVKDSYAEVTDTMIDKVIHFGIDSDRLGPFRPGARQRRLIWIGRIVKEKGPDIAIQLAKAVGYELLILGPVDDLEFFKHEIQPQLDSSTQYLGVRTWDEMRHLVLDASAMLVTTRFPEGFSWVALEGLAWGCPVITTTKCGISEIPGISKYILELEDSTSEKLFDVLNSLNEIDREEISNVVRKEASISKMIDAYERYYTYIVHRS